MKSYILLIGSLFFVVSLYAQDSISLEKIWLQYEYYPKSIPSFEWNDASSLSLIRDKNKGRSIIQSSSIETGRVLDTLFDSEQLPDSLQGITSFLDSKDYFLLATRTEAIFRHSSKSFHILYSKESKQWYLLDSIDKQSNPVFSPDQSKLAYVMGNNLYCHDLISMKRISYFRRRKIKLVSKHYKFQKRLF